MEHTEYTGQEYPSQEYPQYPEYPPPAPMPPSRTKGEAAQGAAGVVLPSSPQPYPPPWQVRQPKPVTQDPFKPDGRDLAFAIAAFALGILFTRWALFLWKGWGVTAFTAAYLATTTFYFVKKGSYQKGTATIFWFAVTLLAGASYSLWDNAGFNIYRALFLFCSAVYYTITASGNRFMGKTSNYLFVDGLNAVIFLPFGNFANQYLSFKALKRTGKRGKALPALLGVAIALILAAILIPMLRRADSGGFAALVDGLADALRFINARTLLYFALGLPVAAYLCGLVSGAAHKRGADVIKPEPAQKAVGALRALPTVTVGTVLGVVCAIYAIFILSQLPYFFSAFTGNRPEGWLVYSEYARRGFFELCGVAVINLVVVTLGNLTCKKKRSDSGMLRLFNVALSVITLLLIATAFSKMALYINAYGLTMPRLLPCVFMLFLAIVFIALIALQKWDFSIVRLALVSGAVIMLAMCLSNPDALVAKYNTDRYLSGTLSGYDVEVLYRARFAGVAPALEVRDKARDQRVKKAVDMYLARQEEELGVHVTGTYLGSGLNAYSYESSHAASLLQGRK